MTYVFDPDWCVPTGEFIEEERRAQGLSKRLMAKLIGLDELAYDRLIRGKRKLTPRMAQRLSAISCSAQMWLRLEKQYRDGLAAGKTVLR